MSNYNVTKSEIMKYSTIYKYCLFLCVAMCVAACNEEHIIDDAAYDLLSLQLQASSATTRTNLLDDGKTVAWNVGDELAVYDYESSKHRFVANNVERAVARFDGKITRQKENFIALYPYELGADNLSAEQEVLVTLPHEQTALKGTFASNLNISIGKGARNVDGSPSNVTFYNVCQLLKFSVPTYAAGKIKQIRFITSSPIAGLLSIDYSKDAPSLSITDDSSTSILINPPMGSTAFDAGTYYIVAAPVELNGFEMLFVCEDASYTLSSGSLFGGMAGKIYSLGTIDLVGTPEVTTIHQYDNGLLQGTSLTISNSPMGGFEWSAVVKNSSNIIVRTLQGVGTLYSSEEDEIWPYLPKGTYTLEYTFTTSNGKKMTKNLKFDIIESPTFSVGISAYTSYSYYKGDGVVKDISKANTLNNVTIYEPEISISGISSRVLNNVNYTFNVTNNFGGVQSSTSQGIYVYPNYTVGNYGAYTLTGNVTFDGVTRTASKMVYITGIPYKATPPTQTDWAGSAQAWNSSYVRLHKHTITKTFYCPENISVKVGQDVSARQHTIATTYKLICSGATLKQIKTSWMNTTTDVATYDSELKTDDPTVKCESSYGSADAVIEGTHVKVTSISVRYR